jgi:hypothetical protein
MKFELNKNNDIPNIYELRYNSMRTCIDTSTCYDEQAIIEKVLKSISILLKSTEIHQQEPKDIAINKTEIRNLLINREPFIKEIGMNWEIDWAADIITFSTVHKDTEVETKVSLGQFSRDPDGSISEAGKILTATLPKNTDLNLPYKPVKWLQKYDHWGHKEDANTGVIQWLNENNEITIEYTKELWDQLNILYKKITGDVRYWDDSCGYCRANLILAQQAGMDVEAITGFDDQGVPVFSSAKLSPIDISPEEKEKLEGKFKWVSLPGHFYAETNEKSTSDKIREQYGPDTHIEPGQDEDGMINGRWL